MTVGPSRPPVDGRYNGPEPCPRILDVGVALRSYRRLCPTWEGLLVDPVRAPWRSRVGC